MKWWLVLVAFLVGLVVTWFLTRKGESETVPKAELAVSASEPLDGDVARQPESAATPGGPLGNQADDQDHDLDDDDASAFAGAPTEFSSEVGAAEGWHRDAQDEDALFPHEPATGAREADTDARPAADAPPVAEATPNGDVAGVGEPDAVKAVDAVEVDRKAARDTPPRSPATKSEQGTFTFDKDSADGDDEEPGVPTERA